VSELLVIPNSEVPYEHTPNKAARKSSSKIRHPAARHHYRSTASKKISFYRARYKYAVERRDFDDNVLNIFIIDIDS
jgi:hypothetical protein